MKKSLVAASSLLLALSTSVLANVTAYYGDRLLHRTVIIDVDNMNMIKDIVTNGEGHYSVNQAGDLPKVYVDTRKSDFVEIIDTKTNTYQGRIDLPHHVRSSEAFNPDLRLQLVTGSDKPMASLIDVDTDEVVASVGDDTVYPPNGDYGGSNATGHPFWLTKHKFVLIDRPNRKISVYDVRKEDGEWQVRYVSSVKTKTAVHHFLHGKKKNIFYATGEGSPSRGISPYIVKYRLKHGKLKKIDRVYLSKGVNVANMGTHHMDIDPTGRWMYVGSTEGIVYIIDLKKKMKVAGVIPAGKGAGHTTFIPGRHLAFITNHKDKFITVIDTDTLTFVKNIVVSGEQRNGAILQSHTTYVDKDERYFYAFATDNGVFYRIDLDTLEVDATLDVGGTPLQGVYIDDENNDDRGQVE